MKSLLTKIFAVLCLAAVTCQATTTNTIAIPLSQLPALGPNPITALDFLPGDNYEGTQYVTVKIPIALLGSNITAGILTNFVTTLNPVITTNPPVIANDIVSGTNGALEAYNVGGDIANAATASNAVVLAIGDSYTDGIGFPSPSMIFGYRLRAIYGDDGQAGRIGGWGGGWGNNPTVLNRTPPTSIWPAGLIAEVIPGDGTNAITGSMGPAGANGSNYCQRVGVSFMATPYSTNFALCIWSPTAGVTNYYTVADNATTPTYHMTNWALPSAPDYSISLSSLGGTNFVINTVFVGTNSGVQYWQYGFAGYNNDNLLTIGSNVWAQIIAAINPHVILYSSIHLGTSGGDTTLATHTNLLRNLLGNTSTNCRVVVVGNPPNSSGDMRVIDAYDRMACQSFGWYYADLWSAFPSFTTEYNGGLMNYGDGGVHASMIGGYARSAALCRLLGIQQASRTTLDFRGLLGRIPNGYESGNTVTNGMYQPVFNSLTVKNTVPYFQSGIEIDSGNVVNFGGYFHFQWGQNFDGIGSLYWNSGYGSTLAITNAAALGSVSTATATAGSVTVTNTATAQTVVATNLCLAGQFGGITQFYVSANSSNYISCPAGKTYFVTWNGARALNTLIWTNGYGVGSPVTITNLAWPVPGALILKSGWGLSIYDTQGYPAGGVYYPL